MHEINTERGGGWRGSRPIIANNYCFRIGQFCFPMAKFQGSEKYLYLAILPRTALRSRTPKSQGPIRMDISFHFPNKNYVCPNCQSCHSLPQFATVCHSLPHLRQQTPTHCARASSAHDHRTHAPNRYGVLSDERGCEAA